MRKLFIVVGIGLLLVGLFWPWIGKIPFGRLPGDVIINKPNVKIFLPITSMLLLSLILSAILWLFRK